jgi:hypothetical protein
VTEPARASEGEASITIHSSWRGVVGGYFGAGVIALGGSYGVLAAGFRWFPVIIFVIGWGLVAVMALDFPVASTFSAQAVERRMALRRQRFEWRPDDRLSRTAPKIILGERRLEHGGLTLVRGKRRYLLVDRPESGAEYDEIVRIVEAPGAGGAQLGASRLPRPADSLPPSWLYRRARWRPDTSTDR